MSDGSVHQDSFLRNASLPNQDENILEEFWVQTNSLLSFHQNTTQGSNGPGKSNWVDSFPRCLNCELSDVRCDNRTIHPSITTHPSSTPEIRTTENLCIMLKVVWTELGKHLLYFGNVDESSIGNDSDILIFLWSKAGFSLIQISLLLVLYMGSILDVHRLKFQWCCSMYQNKIQIQFVWPLW